MSRDWLEHDAGDDWLDDADSRYVGVIEAAENQQRLADERTVADIRSNLPALIPSAPVIDEVPVDEAKRSELLSKAWSLLDEEQRVFLVLLREKRYNIAAAQRVLVAAGQTFSISVYRRWLSQDADFAFVLKVMKSIAVRDSVDKERMLLRAEEIAEEALAPKPILHKGLPTGYYENNPDTALRANEQLMKTQKMLGNDDAPAGGYSGPALIIQVVQRDGAVIDMSPRGVTIDLPAPPNAA